MTIFLPAAAKPLPAMSSAAALTGWGHFFNAVVGILLIVIWFPLHHKLAHRHPYLDMALKLVLLSGTVIVDATFKFVTSIVTWANAKTAAIIGHFAQGWDPRFGILSFIEIFFVIVCAFEVITLIWKEKNAARGGGTGALAGKKLYDAASKHHDRFGWWAVGPLAVTLPGTWGLLVAGSFADLAVHIGNPIAQGFGLG